ncbi:Protein EPIDERMAL PATTERNING FACTOR [Parasponia andersonii]|uniref:Epidermal patterning factor-like protein n=1 Tax=Parasponia andersonii TaxID=3476 RepID=A0A2P5A7P0_PARAD|nr:Protein EPIDERMAL PATTERNING FACTOR [Parasponia andersonii]
MVRAHREQEHNNYGDRGDNKEKKGHPLEVGAGSRLPDCSHASGSCTPCRLAMVSFICTTSLTEPETCPFSYRCICNTKSYPVP